MEHYALEILAEAGDDGNVYPTEAAKIIETILKKYILMNTRTAT